MLRLLPVTALAILVLFATTARAQSLGVFRWQLQPYCNVLSLTVTQNGGVYRLEGTDDQCGSAQAASVDGTAHVNLDGSVGFGLTIVAAPGGSPVHVDATISVSTLSGTWRDSTGASGGFALTPAAGSGGNARPAGGRIGALGVDPTQIQLRITNGCTGGQFLQGIAQSGAVVCGTPAGGGTVTSVNAGYGLAGGGTSGAVALALSTFASGSFNFSNLNGFISAGFFGQGTAQPVLGSGARMMWVPSRAAFRAGEIDGAQWDSGNLGAHSAAFGSNPVALGTYSFAAGQNAAATGEGSTAVGRLTIASGLASVAFGNATLATGIGSFAAGYETKARGLGSAALGRYSEANANFSIAIGHNAHANGEYSVALGKNVNALTGAPGNFIFGDSTSTATLVGTAPDQFLVRASGGVAFYSNAQLTTGVTLAAGGGSFQNLSDAAMKENFRDLAAEDVLAKLAAMPIREWNYKSQEAAIRHVGPTAQDFHAAFALGEDPLRINTVDADGIALRAVQALEARTTELMRRDSERSREIAELQSLRAEIEALRVLVAQLMNKDK